MDGIKEFMGMSLVALMLLLLAAIPIYFLVFGIGSYECYAHAKMLNFNHKYGVIPGCYVEYEKDKWIAIDNYKVIKTN